MTQTITHAERDFLRGFAAGAKTGTPESDWADYSRQLSDAEIARQESRGYDRGLEHGREYARMK
uniref:Uncharacterized protein n=1 Tax=viral metagenome TaxID=1070528 RepID=A0A6M3JLU1_9ZZZZ